MESKTIVKWACWGYMAIAAIAYLVMFFGGDSWWPGTLLLFGPRWVAAVPLVVLVPLAIRRNRGSILPLTLAALIVLGIFMGFSFTFRKAEDKGRPVLRVITCNINNGNFNVPTLGSLIRESSADLVALQECPPELRLKLPPGWRMINERGLAILSRWPIRSEGSLPVFPPASKWPVTSLLYCLVDTPAGAVTFCSVQLPTPRTGLMTVLDKRTMVSLKRKGRLIDDTDYRRDVSRQVEQAVMSLHPPVIIAGDFNMPAESTIFREFWGDYTNAFSKTGVGYGWTALRKVRWLKFGVRIDHVLTDEGLVTLICSTGPDVGSDHIPLIADVARKSRTANGRGIGRQ